MKLASVAVLATVGYVSGRVFGPPIVKQWGPGLEQATTRLLQTVDALTWETWRWVLAGAAGLYILTVAGFLVSQVTRRGPEGLSNVLVLAHVPGVLVGATLVGCVLVLVLVVFVLYGSLLLLRAAARKVVPGVRAAWWNLEMWRSDRRRRGRRLRARHPHASRVGRRSRLRADELSGLEDDLPTGAPWPGKAA